MNDLKHTSGPWSIRQVESAFMIVHESECAVICTTNDWDEKFKDEEQANARLIAAAPELLEALGKLVGFFDGSVSIKYVANYALPDAITAIAKAKGE